jgi:hypothetical protein
MKYLDILGHQPKLYTNESERVMTRFGFIISLISMASSLRLSIYFLVQFFTQTNFNVISEEQTEFNKSVTINEFPFMMKLVISNETPLDSSI